MRSSLAQFYLKPYLLLAYGKIDHQIRVRAHFEGTDRTYSCLNAITGSILAARLAGR
jgi:hypothetical protein